MFNISEIIEIAPFSISGKKKSLLFNQALSELTNHHHQYCSEYKSILDALKYNPNGSYSYDQFPFLPIHLFKSYELSSIDKNNIFKVINSSGTSGSGISKIYLNKENASVQTKVLTKIVSDTLGIKRLPMLVIDSEPIGKRRLHLGARNAAITGFSIFGKDITYSLEQNLELDVQKVRQFLEKHRNQKVFIFGFTSIVWKYFVKYLLEQDVKLPPIDGTLIHGGGWKKLTDEAVDNVQFKSEVNKTCGIEKVINYYGMVEQTGSIFLECSQGYLHCSIFSEILIRRNDFSLCKFSEVGLVQLISLLPTSYPGHNIITEDLGEIVGIDDCRCGRLGKYFLIHGRAEKAEIRGCSDAVE